MCSRSGGVVRRCWMGFEDVPIINKAMATLGKATLCGFEVGGSSDK